jgi:hypothetical protein
VKPAVLALAALGLAACAHESGRPTTAAARPVIANPIKLAVKSVTVSDGLDPSLPGVFEQQLCNKLFEYNGKLVICPDQIKALMDNRRDLALLGNDNEAVDLPSDVDAPRVVNLQAAKAGEKVLITVIVDDRAGATLLRFSTSLNRDGSDLVERADEAAIQVLGIK